jgi:hypothetical protein
VNPNPNLNAPGVPSTGTLAGKIKYQEFIMTS